MSAKIIFIDHKRGKYQKLLLDQGYALARVKSLSEIEKEIEAGGAQLLIHGIHPHKNSWGVCEKLQERYPAFPVIHLFYGPVSRLGRKTLSNPFHEQISVAASSETLLRKVGGLIHFGKLQRELVDVKQLQLKTSHFSNLIRHLDTAKVVEGALQYFCEELGCRNAIWFPEGVLRSEIERYSRKRNSKAEEDEKYPRRAWVPHREPESHELTEVFRDWCIVPVLMQRLEQMPNEIRHTEGLDVVLPVRSHKEGKNLGHVLFNMTERWESEKDKDWLRRCLELFEHQLDQAAAYGQLQSLTYTDDLTELYNQRYLPLILDQELSRAQRLKHEFSVLFVDVDFFKLVNDTKGHLVGSRVLIELGQIFRRSIRKTDFAFRYGGDEYVIVLSGTDSKNAAVVAERIRKSIEHTIFNVNGAQVRVTVSIGIATYPEHAQTTGELLQMADEAMYYGKNKSRNIVYIAS